MHFLTSVVTALGRGHFLHEHPLTATSWDEPAITALRAQPQVQEATANQCCFGLAARDPSGKMELVMKPTRFLSPLLLRSLRAAAARGIATRSCWAAAVPPPLRSTRQASAAPSCAVSPGSSGETAWLCRLESAERSPADRASAT